MRGGRGTDSAAGGGALRLATFIDRHRVKDLTPAVQHQFRIEARDGIRDPSGTVPLGHWLEDGKLFCVLVAPDEAAVCEHHHARGVDCDSLHRVSDSDLARPLSDHDRELVDAAISRFWNTGTEPDFA